MILKIRFIACFWCHKSLKIGGDGIWSIEMRQNFSVPPRQICKQVRLLQNCDFCSKLCLKWNQGTEAELVYGIWETELVLGESLSVALDSFTSDLWPLVPTIGARIWHTDLVHQKLLWNQVKTICWQIVMQQIG